LHAACRRRVNPVEPVDPIAVEGDMKTLRMLLFSVPALTAAVALHAADETKFDSRTVVNFFEPERFTDVRDSLIGSDKGRDAILGQIRDYLVTRSKLYVPDGQKLTVTITDVKLAGDFEPARNPRLDDVRIIRDIYPPRIELAFKLTDADGNELAHGTRNLTDVMFMQKLLMNPNDSLRYEKELLDDWMRTEFKAAKS
jgi:hypothetical protein